MSSYYYDYGYGAYRSGFSGGGDGYYYHGYTYDNSDTGAYHHYQYTSDNGTIHTESVSHGGGYYQYSSFYDNPESGYYRSEHVTAQLYGYGQVYQHYQGITDIPAYNHDEFVNQTVSGQQAQGYEVYIQGAQVNTYFDNDVTYGYVWGKSYASGSGYGEYVSGYRVTEFGDYGPSTSYYGGYRAFGYVPR